MTRTPRNSRSVTTPGRLFVGNFDGKPDLVTVNTGSNNLTLISDFTSADYVTRTISSGGMDPDDGLQLQLEARVRRPGRGQPGGRHSGLVRGEARPG